MRKKIIAITGKSAVGKTTIADYLRDKYGIPMIESYPDRPRRTPDETGHTFISDDEFNLIPERQMLAFTNFGAYRYC